MGAIFHWVLIFLELFGTASFACIIAEKEALQQIRHSLVDPSDILQSWGEDTDCCKWRGVNCDRTTGYVTELDLSNPGRVPNEQLSGQLDSALDTLKHLQYLDLSSNQFLDLQIPNFLANLGKLRYLNLSSAGFLGRVPTEFGNLSRLEVFDASHNNYLSAEKLNWLSNLQHLKYLDLSQIDLYKVGNEWMHVMNSVPPLEELHLGSCDLSTLPMNLLPLNLTSLRVLDLQFNDFHSSIPLWIANITTLTSIDFSFSSFNPTQTYPFPMLPRLQVLNMTNNHVEVNVSNLFAESWGMIRVMLLSSSFLYGNLPPEIGNITSLAHLDLSRNKISGTIPKQIGNLENLVYLNLENNGFVGPIPKEISNLHKLQHMVFEGNHIQGATLESFCPLKNLEALNLSNATISGSIPTCLWEMSSLKEIDLSWNKLTGMLPTTMTKLWMLERFNIRSNFLQGLIFEEHFRNLSRLTTLDISGNYLVFNVSQNWIPPFQLTQIKLDSCYLGPQFPFWLQTQIKVEVLGLSNTSISGDVPPWFWNFTSITYDLDLSNNAIRGQLPSPFNLHQMFYLDLSSNNFFGPMPCFNSSTYVLDLSNNEFSGKFPPNSIEPGSAGSANVFLASGNRISGILPSISNLFNLESLDLSHNKISGPIPPEIGNCTSLVVLDLSNNHLYGSTNWSAFPLYDLRSLHLSNNNLSGQFPFFIQNCTNLIIVDLGENKFSGKIPSWMGSSSFSDLRILRLSSNMFEGTVPSQLSELRSLQVLDIAHNHFTGSIPASFGKFEAMKTMQTFSYPRIPPYAYYNEWLTISTNGPREYSTNLDLMTSMDLSDNHLSGEISPELTNLFGLIVLNVSRNTLTGKIPKEIGNLKQLTYLDVSRNHLSGEIPASLADLTFLSHLNVSYNNLSGKIPWGRQLQTLNDPSIYSGNNQLCGAPLNTSCQGDVTPTSPSSIAVNQDVEPDNIDIAWFVGGVAPGCVIGFWVVVGTLMLKKSWRIAHFRFFDSMGEGLFTALAFNTQTMRKR